MVFKHPDRQSSPNSLGKIDTYNHVRVEFGDATDAVGVFDERGKELCQLCREKSDIFCVIEGRKILLRGRVVKFQKNKNGFPEIGDSAEPNCFFQLMIQPYSNGNMAVVFLPDMNADRIPFLEVKKLDAAAAFSLSPEMRDYPEFTSDVCDYGFPNGALVAGARSPDSFFVTPNGRFSVTAHAGKGGKRQEDGVIALPAQRLIAAADAMGSYDGGPTTARAVLRGVAVGAENGLDVGELGLPAHLSLKAQNIIKKWRLSGATLAVVQAIDGHAIACISWGDARWYVIWPDSSEQQCSPEDRSDPVSNLRFIHNAKAKRIIDTETDPDVQAFIAARTHDDSISTSGGIFGHIKMHSSPVKFDDQRRKVAMVCSDGISRFLADEEIFAVMREQTALGTVAQIPRILQTMALARQQQEAGFFARLKGRSVLVPLCHWDNTCAGVMDTAA
ncbi:hypothetical protein KBD59_03945 [Candidatus Gracilibacteria bacterium]|nr:hypothetical protein [Candidatus Gracilibacteria bacterium]